MKIKYVGLFLVTLGVSLRTFASADVVEFVRNSWAEPEAVLTKALAIRAQVLEQKTGMKFDCVPVAALEYLDSIPGRGAVAAVYSAEIQTVQFPVSLMYELTVRLKCPLRLATPEQVAADENFAEVADHELGHSLADSVSRKVKSVPFYTLEQFDAVSRNEQIGLNIIAEGIGTWFGYVLHPRAGEFSEAIFSESVSGPMMTLSSSTVFFEGGYWIVRDILKLHGRRGLEWLVTHPLTITDDKLRASAVAYRERALEELAKK